MLKKWQILILKVACFLCVNITSILSFCEMLWCVIHDLADSMLPSESCVRVGNHEYVPSTLGTTVQTYISIRHSCNFSFYLFSPLSCINDPNTRSFESFAVKLLPPVSSDTGKASIYFLSFANDNILHFWPPLGIAFWWSFLYSICTSLHTPHGSVHVTLVGERVTSRCYTDL